MTTPQLGVRIGADLADIKAGLATLRGDLQKVKGDAARSMDGLDSAGAKLKQFAAGAKVALVAISGVLAGAAAAVKSAIDRADEMGKAAQAVGIGTEALSELSYAAKLSGVEFSSLRTGLNAFNRALTGNEDLIRKLGIATRDASGDFRQTQDIVGDLANVFQTLPDGPQKSALAIKLFGRAGTELIPLLNQGSDGLAEFASEARDLGLVITDDAAKSAEQFNDDLTRLKSVMTGVANAVAAEVLPAISGFAAEQARAARESGGAAQVAGVFAQALKVVTAAAVIVKNAIEGIVNVLAFLVDVSLKTARVMTTALGGSFELLGNYWQRLADGRPIDAVREYVKEALVLRREVLDGASALPGQIAAGWDAMRSGLTEAGEDIGSGLHAIFSGIDDGVAGVNRQIDALGNQSDEAKAKAAALREQLDLLLGKGGGEDSEARRKAAALKRELEAAERAAKRAEEEQRKLLEARAKRINEGLFELQNELLRATGRGAEAAFNELEARYAQLLADLRAAGDTEGEALLERVLGIKKTQIQLDDFKAQMQAITSELRAGETSLGAQAGGGLIGQGEAERRINDLRTASLEKLKDLRAAVKAYYGATEDPSVIQFLQELDGAIGQVAQTQDMWRQRVEDALAGAFGSFFNDLIAGAKSFKDAFRDMVRNFLAGIAQMIAAELAKRAATGIIGLFAPVKHAGGIVGSGGPMRMVNPLLFGMAPRYHAGGIAGLGPDEVPAILQRGEEVLTRRDPRHRSNGGLSGGGEAPIRNIVVFGEDQLADALAGAAGERVIVTHARNNRMAISGS